MSTLRRWLSLGICNPATRMLVWVVGCASLSVAALVAGAAAVIALTAVYGVGVTAKLSEDP